MKTSQFSPVMPPEHTDRTCPAVGFQRATVCVPVTVRPFAHAGRTVTHCCGDPVVVAGEQPCAGTKNGVCHFTISQTICVEVPVEFGAVPVVGDPFVDCLGASEEDICTDCTRETDA
ncbi:MAG: hypothetical protein PUC32_00205 [Oscillospiraceae bacterium]|nr:hypothetical protein [Oscillospiraceae bacterium]